MRYSRMKSDSGINHILLRAKDKPLFCNLQDYAFFKELLTKTLQKYNYTLYAYCLNENSIHLLIKEKSDAPMQKILQALLPSYVLYYNNRHKTSGKLFLDRAISEPIESKEYLVSCVRFINQLSVNNKSHSSAEEYIIKVPKLVSRTDVYTFLGGAEGYIEFLNKREEKPFANYNMFSKLTDNQLINEISNIYDGDISKIKTLPKAQQKHIISVLKTIPNAKCAQIARVTGVSDASVRRW